MKKYWYITIPLVLYSILVGIPSIFHSIWLDEAQAWNIARDLPFFSMFTLSSYEGNGMLWHMLLYPLAHLGLPVVSMQILNFIFALGTAYLILKYSPFPVWMRMMLITGYFFVFEYAVLARNYQISVLLLMLIAVIYPTRFVRPWRFSILLVLLAFTNVHAALMISVIVCMFIYEVWNDKSLNNKKTIITCLIFIAYAGVAQILMLIPVSNTALQLSEIHTHISIGSINMAISSVTHAFLPIPIIGPVFWNKLVFESKGIIGIMVALLILICTFVPFFRQKKILVLYGTFSILLLSFFFFKYAHYMRHDGFLFIFWVFVLWISAENSDTSRLWPRSFFSKVANQRKIFFARPIILIILIAQSVAGAVTLYMVYGEPVSNAQFIANYINTTPSNVPVLVYTNTQVPPLSAYQKGKREFFCLTTYEDCSYLTWSTLAWSTIKQISTSTQYIYNPKPMISLFEKQHSYQPYYIIFDSLYTRKLYGFINMSNPVVSANNLCITANCQYYMYYVDPRKKF